jgi:hypothetical protein
MLIGLWIAVLKITFESLAMCLRGGQEEWETGVFFCENEAEDRKTNVQECFKETLSLNVCFLAL